jgi:hypothetical protein
LVCSSCKRVIRIFPETFLACVALMQTLNDRIRHLIVKDRFASRV